MLLKKFLVLFFFIQSLFVVAQNDIYFEIDHMIGNTSFVGRPIVDISGVDGGEPFLLTRMEYYISGIEITHDSGQVTALPNTYLIINSIDTIREYLGNFPINEVESISFYIGIDSLVNHSDPSLYAVGHPLGPRFPSMHWGWTAGFRFVAFEAGTGPTYNQLATIHALGDKNYFRQTHTISAVRQGNELTIGMEADYAAAFAGISVDANLFYHGDSNEAEPFIKNFRDHVFRAATVGLQDVRPTIPQLTIYPNPNEGDFNIENTSSVQLEFQIHSIVGQEVMRGQINGNQVYAIEGLNSGVYILQLIVDGESLSSQKLIVK